MTPIYHITHMSNLPGILAANGLWCDRLRAQNCGVIVGIAHQHIKDRRAERKVPCAARGTLSDYVPFYFAPRSPMLYTVHQGNVNGYAEGQRPIVHLVSSVEQAIALGKPWCFTDGHADMAFSSFSDDYGDLDGKVDWSVMSLQFWNDTDMQPDRKRRRQAEFLAHQSFPWTAIAEIGVVDDGIRSQMETALAGSDHRPPVVVHKDWYY